MSDQGRLAGVTELSAWIASKDDDPVGAGAPAYSFDAADEAAAPSDEGDEAPALIDEATARDLALRSLGRRAASRHDLDRTLERRGVEADVRETVLDRLVEEGYLDDEQLARDLAERLRERKGMGERGVAAELRRRGLDPAVLDEPDRDDELERAIEVAADRRRRMHGLDDETAERRLAGFLQRRGFGGGAVRIAIERTRPRGPRFR